jgi:hypothetical protein
VVAQLETLLDQKLHLLEAPRGLLTIDALVAEEGVRQNSPFAFQSGCAATKSSSMPTALVGSTTSLPLRSR